MDPAHYSAYVREEANHEIGRLEAILRNPAATEDDRQIAEAMLDFYQDAKTAKTASELMKPHANCRGKRARSQRPRTTAAAA